MKNTGRGMQCKEFDGSNVGVTTRKEDLAVTLNRQGEVKVYKLNPDGTKGELKRTMEAFPEGCDMSAFKNIKMRPNWEKGEEDMIKTSLKISKEELERRLRETKGSLCKAARLCDPIVADVTFRQWLIEEEIIPPEGLRKSAPSKQEIEKALYDYAGNIQQAAERYGVSEILFMCWINVRSASLPKLPNPATNQPLKDLILANEKNQAPTQKRDPETATNQPGEQEPDENSIPYSRYFPLEDSFISEDEQPIPYSMNIDFVSRGQAVGELVQRKNAQYGDSFKQSGKILAILYPHGITADQYQDALGVTRVIDKLFRIAAGKQGDEDPWRDIAGYGLLGMEAE